MRKILKFELKNTSINDNIEQKIAINVKIIAIQIKNI